ncbi:MAG: MotA/TolQ/ExbB proton channel family protein [Myxococcales bacterium]|nr:MotA/TolQ/ExbB proton channel family protein [Myxococcales bacterium]
MDFNLVTLWHETTVPGKLVIVVLAIMGVYMLAIGIERFLTFSRARSRSLEFVLSLQQRLRDHNIKGAFELSQQKPQNPISVVIEAALREYMEGLEALKQHGPNDVGDFDLVDNVNRAIDRVKEREIADLKRGLSGLATIGSTAPFVGLFGTVVGIIAVFSNMKVTGGGGIAAVAGGIGEALVVTAAGLLVAIPAVMMFNYFTNAIDNFVVDMNETTSELISFMLREGRKAA